MILQDIAHNDEKTVKKLTAAYLGFLLKTVWNASFSMIASLRAF